MSFRSRAIATAQAFVLLSLTLALAAGPASSAIDPDVWVTNGTVHALEEFDGTLYLGGDFTEVSPATGSGVPWDTASVSLPANFPRVVGDVHVVIPDGAGGWYIGGSFNDVGGLSRDNVAHITSSLTVGPWAPLVVGQVHALRRRDTGSILLGGEFTLVNSSMRPNLAEVSASGVLTSFGVFPIDGPVYALETVGNTVIVGGGFTSISGASRNRLCSITFGFFTSVTAWDPNANGTVHAIELVPQVDPLQPNIVVGGSFTAMSGQPRGGLAQFTMPGALTAWNPGTNGTVLALELGGSSLYAGGTFTNAGGQSRDRAAAVDAATGAVLAWNPGLNDTVDAIVADGPGTVYLGGRFTTVGGQPIRRLAKVTPAGGTPLPFAPNPNDDVRGIALGSGRIFAGGTFTGAGGAVRHNVAAIDRATGAPTSWAPLVDGTVRALELENHGPFTYSVYVGGDFQAINGQPRSYLGAIDFTGSTKAFNPAPTGPVHALVLDADTLFVGGSFVQIGGEDRYNLAALNVTTGLLTPWTPFVEGTVHTIARRGFDTYAGGDFTFYPGGLLRQHLGVFSSSGGVRNWAPGANAPVHAIALDATSIYVGGEFTQIAGAARNRIAQLAPWPTPAVPVMVFNPGADLTVRALVVSRDRLLVGGDFSFMGGSYRPLLAQFDLLTGADLGSLPRVWEPRVGAQVRTLAVGGPWTYAGGSFRQVEALAQANLIGFGQDDPSCPVFALNSPVGGRPRAIVAGEFHGDGIPDLVVCDVSAPQGVLMRGTGAGDVGDGFFVTGQVLALDAPPMHAATGDFDANGHLDVAFTTNAGGMTGEVTVFLNDGMTLSPLSPVALAGRVDGLAIADLDQDGILDLAVCVVDSAGVPKRGSLDVLRGGGTGGAWNGTFGAAQRITSASGLMPRRVIVQDLNLDGVPDFLVSGKGTRYEVHMGPGLAVQCALFTVTTPLYAGPSGVSMVTGDINEDGLTDLLSNVGRRLYLQYRNTNVDPACGIWFNTSLANSITLPSTPRDLALLDADRDGILDLYLVYDSLSTVEFRMGLGVGGVGDGTFGPPEQSPLSGWSMLVGDFEENGGPDLVLSSPDCGTVSVLAAEPAGSNPPTDLALLTPNGGEAWPQLMVPPVGEGLESAQAVELGESIDAVFVHSSPAPPLWLASTQAITWSTGDGVHLVDVEVSRDGGATWQVLATRMAGTTMPWIVTPPATAQARVRVVDAFVSSRLDGSDADFAIEPATTGVPEPGAEGLPSVPAFALRGENPAREALRFRVDVPRASDVTVEVYDVSGRAVREVARGLYPAGRHDLVWDARDARGSTVPAGVYFVRGRVGGFSAVRKVAIVR